MSNGFGRLAQLVRALALQARGHRFESYIAHHLLYVAEFESYIAHHLLYVAEIAQLVEQLICNQ